MSHDLLLHEEHGEAVASWFRLDYRSETVACFDRHLDLKPLPAAAATALRDAADDPEAVAGLNRQGPLREAPGAYGLDDFWAAGPVLGAVDRLLWVTPDDSGDSRARREALMRTVSLIRTDPGVLDVTRFVDGALHTYLCGLQLEVHSPRSFVPRMRLLPEARVDVDLDWFFHPMSGLERSPSEMITLLDLAEARGRLDSLTFSVRSGFLPESHRYLAGDLADLTGRRLGVVARTVADDGHAELLAALAAGELPPTAEEADSGLGLTIAGLTALQQGQLAEAAACWERSTAGGGSTWLAYKIGVTLFEAGRHDDALGWLDRARGEELDTLEAHAAVLRCLCLLRGAGGPASLGTDLRQLLDRYPLHLGVVRCAHTAAESEGDGDLRALALDRARQLAALVKP